MTQESGVRIVPSLRRETTLSVQDDSSYVAFAVKTKAESSSGFQQRVLRSTSRLPKKAGPQMKTLRRFRGVLVECYGVESKVILESGGDTFQYFLPTSNLWKNGIRLTDQPFEMDEIEIALEGGRKATGYAFRPLANERDMKREVLSLDAEREAKLAALRKLALGAKG